MQGKIEFLHSQFRHMNEKIREKEARVAAAQARLDEVRGPNGRAQRRRAVLKELKRIEAEIRERGAEPCIRSTFGSQLESSEHNVTTLRKERLICCSLLLSEEAVSAAGQSMPLHASITWEPTLPIGARLRKAKAGAENTSAAQENMASSEPQSEPAGDRQPVPEPEPEPEPESQSAPTEAELKEEFLYLQALNRHLGVPDDATTEQAAPWAAQAQRKLVSKEQHTSVSATMDGIEAWRKSFPRGVPAIIVEAAENHFRVNAQMEAANKVVAESLTKHKEMVAAQRARRQSEINKPGGMRRAKVDRQAGRRMRASTGTPVWQDPSSGLDSLNAQLGARGSDPSKALKMLYDPAGLHVSRCAASCWLYAFAPPA
jgi:hypothetical protein